AGRPAEPVAYLCGRVRRPVFERKLDEAGIPIVIIETYDTPSLVIDAALAARVMGRGAIDATLVYSANAAEQLAGLMAKDMLQYAFGHTTLVCISARVGEVFGEKARKIVIAGEPSET